MRMIFTRLRVFVAALAALAFAAGAASAEIVFNRGNSAEPESLDPHHADTQWESHIIGDMLMGLFTEDAASQPIYGAAESHTVSDNGLVWTFKIRDHTWSDGTPVKAGDFVFAWRREVDPATHTKYATLLYLFKNAQSINEGKMPPESLGARAIDDKTLELTLEHPASYLPQLLMHQTTYPLPEHALKQWGKDWVRAGHYLANGPYMLAEWLPNDHVKLVRNPKFYDPATIQIDTVVFFPTENTSAALRRLRAGELDIQDGISSEDMRWIRDNMPEALHLDNYLALTYIVANTRHKPFDDVRVRQALSLAMDRDAIVGKLMDYQELPAYSLVPPGTAGYPGGTALQYTDLAYAQRLEKARELMVAAGYGPDNHLRVTFDHNSIPDNKRIAAALQQMWRQIYFDIELRQSEARTLYSVLKEHDFEIAQASWVGDYNDAQNFLFLLESENIGLNYGQWNNPDFDALMDRSANEIDAAARGVLLAQAEQLALDQVAMIPLRFLKTRNIVQPYVKNWIANLRDINRTRWLSIEGRETASSAPSHGTGAGSSVAIEEKGWLESLWDWFLGLLCSWFGIACQTA